MSLLKIIIDDIKQWSDLNYFEHEIELNFSVEKNIVKNSESYNKKLLEKLKFEISTHPEINREPKDQDDEIYISQYREHLFGHQEEIITKILNRQRSASILTAYSLIEGSLKNLCSLIDNEFHFKLKLKDLNSNDDLQKYKLYFEKVLEINFTSLQPNFDYLVLNKYFRNKIAHNNSIIEFDKIKLAKNTIGLKLTNYGEIYEIQISDIEYINSIINIGEIFILDLLKLVDRRYIELKNIL